MDHTLRLASQDLANDLRALLEEIDPARWRDEFETAARARVRVLVERVREMQVEAAASSDARVAVLRERLAQLRETLDQAAAALPSREQLAATMPTPQQSWAAFQREVQPAYEALAASLRAMTATAPRPLRPTNYTRSVFHVACGLCVVALIEALPSRGWLVGLPLAVALWAWITEVSRRIWPSVNDVMMKVFGRVAHPHERHRINSSTWFVTGLLVIGALFPRYAAASGVAVLALADPAAALIGRRFGRTKLRAGRSLQGTLAFVVVGFVAALITIVTLHRGPTVAMVGSALAAAIVGALAELYTESLDDNFTIPVAAAAATAAVGTLLGVR